MLIQAIAIIKHAHTHVAPHQIITHKGVRRRLNPYLGRKEGRTEGREKVRKEQRKG
jgi:hypothetical protein